MNPVAIAGALLSAAGPIALRVMATLGFGILMFAGLDAALNQLIVKAQTEWASLPTAMLQLAAMSGLPEAMSLLFGALSARVTAWVTASATRFVVKG